MPRAESDPAREGWHPQDVMAAVRKTGETLSSLARANGIKPGTLSTVFRARYPRGQKIIADHLGVPRQTIWPQHYDENDAPRLLNRRRAA